MKKAKISRLCARKRAHEYTTTEKERWGSYVHMLDELVRSANIPELSETDLGNNSAKLSASGTDTVRGRPVTSRERFTGYDERGRVGPEVLEEVGETVEEHEGLCRRGGRCELIITEAHDDEENGKDNEAHELDWLASPAIDEKEGDPVAGNDTCSNEDHVSDGNVVEVLVNGGGTRQRFVG